MMKKFLRVLWNIVVIAVAVCLVILVLDCLSASHDPSGGLLFKLNSAVRSIFSQQALSAWDSFKSQTALMFTNLWDIIRNKGV